MKRFFFAAVCLFVLAPLLPVSGKFSGFLKPALEALESAVRANHEPSDIIEKLSQSRSFVSWPEDLDPALRLYVAVQWFEQGRFDAAAKLLDSVRPTQQTEMLWRFYRAAAFLEALSAESAKPLLDEIGKAAPQDPDYLFLKSSYQTLTEDYAGAIKTLTALIEEDGGNGKAYLQRGMLYVHTFSNELAAKDLKKAVALLPKGALRQRQMAYFQTGLLYEKYYFDAKKAAKYYRDGEALDPDSSVAREWRLKRGAR